MTEPTFPPLELDPRSLSNTQIIDHLTRVLEGRDLPPIVLTLINELHRRDWQVAAGAESTPTVEVPINDEQAEHLEQIVKQRRAPNTQRAYDRAWARFWGWVSQQCGKHHDDSQPAAPSAVATYFSDLNKAGKSYKTIEQARAAIGAKHRERNWPDPTKDERVVAVLRGIARDPNRKPTRKATPIDEEKFERIMIALRNDLVNETIPPTPGQTSMLDLVLLSVMRDGLLRRSEAVAIRWGDITARGDGSATLLIRRSKTDQTAEGADAFLTPRSFDLITRFRLELMQRQAMSRVENEHKVFDISESQVNRIVKRAVKLAGITGSGYSGHSLRRGMAIDLIRKGESIAAVQQVGRWKTPSLVYDYVRDELAAQNAVARNCG